MGINVPPIISSSQAKSSGNNAGAACKMYVRITLLKGNQTTGVDGLRCLPDMFEYVAVR